MLIWVLIYLRRTVVHTSLVWFYNNTYYNILIIIKYNADFKLNICFPYSNDKVSANQKQLTI